MSSSDSADMGSRRRTWLRPLSFLALIVVAAIAVGGFVVTRQVVHDQEHRLIKQRAEEAGLYLQGALSGLNGTFSSLAADTALAKADPAKFAARTQPMVTAKGGYRTVALLRTSSGTPTVTAISGTPLGTIDPAIASTVQQAVAKSVPAGALVATPLFDGAAGARRLGFVYVAPQLPGYAVYAENEVHPEQPTPVTAGQPFSELVVALYAVPRVDGSQLLVATGTHLPLHGQVASSQVAVGSGAKWLLVAKARHALVGSVAEATPWGLLGVGLLAAVLATAVVETLSRRREYAAEVAEQRTRELKQSLEELAAAQHQLVRQERLAAIGELASTIGHELRNPLGVISNALFLLRRDLAAAPTDGASARHLATAEREVSAATVIVSDLLEFARQRDPVMIQVDMTALIDEVVAVLPPPTGITVQAETTAAVVGVADRDMLRQVLLNLLGNAYQAMPEGGHVRIGARSGAGGVHVYVTDNGSGMTPEVQSQLFQPFFTTKARGVGLGLAVCKRIIDAHDGTIDVESADGAGATFTVNLPPARTPDVLVPSQIASGADDLTAAHSAEAQQ